MEKPNQQYQAEAVAPTAPDGNGKTPDLTIDEQSRQEAMANAISENAKRRRVQACANEIEKAVAEILKKYKCGSKFMELREDGQTTRIWIQPVALNEPVAQ
jgi:hypothetical protein